jgi:murein DD-endopeptidase MepM/ murein hydrolase activator NlpD
MKNIIAGQRIWRRKRSFLSRITGGEKGPVPGGSRIKYNTDLIRQIRQKPARGRRRIKKYGAPAPRFNWSNWPNFPRMRKKSREKKGGAFGFSFSPLISFFIGAGILAFFVLSLYWQDISPLFSLALAPEPVPDGEFQRNLASYAGLQPLAAGDETIPLDLMETFSWSSYQVRAGDSVSKIAAAFSISMDGIIASNGISNARRLRVGETLRIPNMDGIPYTVKKGDSLSKISAAMGVPLEAILDANDVQTDTISQGTVLFIPGARMRSEDLKLALGELFIYPIRGRLTSPYGWRNDPISGVRRYHAALDLAAPIGTPVKAAMDGRVSAVGMNATYGKFIILSHSGGYQTMYAHLNTIALEQGARTVQGAKIGEVGNTGYSTGPHLHFAVYKNGRAVNPLELLNQ